MYGKCWSRMLSIVYAVSGSDKRTAACNKESPPLEVIARIKALSLEGSLNSLEGALSVEGAIFLEGAP
jgi:hypothetical protein